MSIVSHRVPSAAGRSIIAQSLSKALVHLRFAESVAQSDPRHAEKMQALRHRAEDLLKASQGEANHVD
jgi:hypothetical protein